MTPTENRWVPSCALLSFTLPPSPNSALGESCPLVISAKIPGNAKCPRAGIHLCLWITARPEWVLGQQLGKQLPTIGGHSQCQAQSTLTERGAGMPLGVAQPGCQIDGWLWVGPHWARFWEKTSYAPCYQISNSFPCPSLHTTCPRKRRCSPGRSPFLPQIQLGSGGSHLTRQADQDVRAGGVC